MTLVDEVRDWVGTEPDDPTVNAALARFFDADHQPERAALTILKRRRADLHTDRSFDVNGDVAWGRVDKANLLGLDDTIYRLEEIIAGVTPGASVPVVSSVPVVGRPDYRGR